jgi:predicted PurR-regulated permease PerM
MSQNQGGIQPTASRDEKLLAPGLRNAVELSIRLGAIALLVIACLMIVAPFMSIIVWALVIAIAADGPHEALSRRLGGRRGLAAGIAVALAMLIFIVPAVQLSNTLASGAQTFAEKVGNADVRIPAPDPRVQDWFLIGPRIYLEWTAASENIGEAFSHFIPQLQVFSRWLLRAGGSAALGILQFAASLLIAGVMLSRGPERRVVIERFAVRMAGEVRGRGLAALAEATIRSVVQGILGVALLQALLAGIGLALAGIPAAGLWALLVLVAAVIQLPVALVLILPVIYAFASIGGVAAVLFAIWCLLVSLLDNVLKPILFGRGVEIPTLIIFMGAIGGMLTLGILGLFLGAVVLALGFALFQAWLSDEEPPAG